MTAQQVKQLFLDAATRADYRRALSAVRRLSGKQQMTVLDALFEAAARIGVQRSTGEPLGMVQLIDGSVTVTWETLLRRPDGSTTKCVESAILEPTDYGSGWRSRTKDVPDEVVEAVTAAALANELKAPKQKRRRLVT